MTDRASCHGAERRDQQDERQPEHERDHQRRDVRQATREIEVARVVTGQIGMRSRDRTCDRRLELAPQRPHLVVGDADARVGHRDLEQRRLTVARDLHRHRAPAAGDLLTLMADPAQLRDRLLAAQSVSAHDQVGRVFGSREGPLDRRVGDADRSVRRHVVLSGLARLDREHGRRQRSEDDDGECQRGAGTVCDPGREHLPHASTAAGARPAPARPHPASVDPVAEQREHRRKHRQRPDDGDQHDQDRAQRHRREHPEAGEQQPGESNHDRHPGDQNRAADRRRGGGQRRVGGRPVSPLELARGGCRTASSRRRRRDRSGPRPEPSRSRWARCVTRARALRSPLPPTSDRAAAAPTRRPARRTRAPGSRA